MAKKDSLGRLVIPVEIVQKCAFFGNSNNIAFGMNTHNEVLVGAEFNLQSLNCSYLGSCFFDEKTHTILIPENVDIALGSGSDYYFAEKGSMLYIYKRPATLDLSKVKAYPKKALNGVSKFLKALETLD